MVELQEPSEEELDELEARRQESQSQMRAGPLVESPPESLKGTRGQLELWLHQQMQEQRDPSPYLSFEKPKEGRVHEQR